MFTHLPSLVPTWPLRTAAAPVQVSGAANSRDCSVFEPPNAGTRIIADIDAAARGMSVSMHAERVLSFLRDASTDAL